MLFRVPVGDRKDRTGKRSLPLKENSPRFRFTLPFLHDKAGFKLRLSITEQNRWWYFIGLYVYLVSTYLLTNHYSLRPPFYLPMTPLDMRVPFLPWTSWIYATIFLLPLLAAALIKGDGISRKIFICFAVMGNICLLVFVIYPTTYPRPFFDVSGRESFLLSFFHMVDTPANCFPSLHVGYAFLAAFLVNERKRKLGSLFILWAVVVAFSTLTTKQHYVWDVVGGYVLARLVHRGYDFFK